VRALEVEARLTLCNMATEFSAVTGLIAPDEKTFAYLEGRRFAPRGADWDAAVASWRSLASDEDATFDREIVLEVDEFAPMVTWGTSPQHAVPVTAAVPALEASGTTREAWERALATWGSRPAVRSPACRSTRPSSAPAPTAASPTCAAPRRSSRGGKSPPGVKAICVPGSMSVKRQAEAEGLDEVFRRAGFEWRESGCSMCFFAGGESFGRQERVISSTNRNFESRQGPETRTHLASPETVAASAIAGCIADVRELMG
jgi:3-isopropylmalate/(R)-2-methylmalate dehydratase large subunit